MNKAIVIDLDGTLLNQKGEISSNTKRVIELAKQDFSIYLATGKSVEVARKYHEELNLSTKMICSQGIEVFNPNGPLELNDPMNIEDFEILFDNEFLRPKKVFLYIKSGEEVFSTKVTGGYDLGVIKMFGNTSASYLCELGPEAPITQFYLSIDIKDQNDLNEVMEYLKNIYPDMSILSWDTQYKRKTIAIKPLGINKWEIFKKLSAEDGVDKIISFGDGKADYEILKNSDISFAMKNGVDDIKKIATHITEKSNEEDGVAFEIEKILRAI